MATKTFLAHLVRDSGEADLVPSLWWILWLGPYRAITRQLGGC